MAVLYPSQRGTITFPAGGACYYCGLDLDPNELAVFWAGESDIQLHPDCAVKLANHLVGDAREALLASGAHPWPHRAAAALREALLATEMRP